MISAFAQGKPSMGNTSLLKLVCPVHALQVYVKHTRLFRLSEQLFICFGVCTKDLPVSKQRLSHWIVDVLALACSLQKVICPIGV